jgi:hypothetical protein
MVSRVRARPGRVSSKRQLSGTAHGMPAGNVLVDESIGPPGGYPGQAPSLASGVGDAIADAEI